MRFSQWLGLLAAAGTICSDAAPALATGSSDTGTISSARVLSAPSAKRAAASPIQPDPGTTETEVKLYHGVPTLFIDGHPSSALAYMTYHPNGKYFRQFAQEGIHLYSFSATPTSSAYKLARDVWVAPDRFDYSHFDQRVALILKADPQARFFPRIYLGAPAWWTRAHPDQCVMMDPGNGHPVLFKHPAAGLVPSWASTLWRRDTDAAITRFVRHVQSSPWADRVIGYHIASGTTEEWMMWGANENAWVGYSKPAVAAFRKWLRNRYQTSAALRRAWNDPNVSLDTASPPNKKERQQTTFGLLRDPAREARVIDFYRFNSDLVADTIAHFAATVKKVTQRKKMCGIFYGYVLELAGEQRMQNAGHLDLAQVLRCPDLDFLTSPTSYTFRGLGSGYSHFMSLTDSARLHGKLWFDENDIRTWRLTNSPLGQWGRSASYGESLSQQQRELANVLCNACGMWWFDMQGGWYDDPRMMKAIGKLKRIADQSLAWLRQPVDQIAVVVDGPSHIYLRPGNQVIGREFIIHQLSQLGRIGAPIGYYDLSDLDRLQDKKMFIFLDCFAPSPEERRQIEVLKSQGRVLVWLYASGLYGPTGMDPSFMRTLVGMKIAMHRKAHSLQALPVAGGSPWGTPKSANPWFSVADPAATTVAKYSHGGESAVAIRHFDGWTSVYSAIPILPANFLRGLAREAGVHIYVNGDDVVRANQSLLSLTVDQAGPRKVDLPSPSTVTDLFSGKFLARNTNRFTVEMPARSTALWRILPENR